MVQRLNKTVPPPEFCGKEPNDSPAGFINHIYLNSCFDKPLTWCVQEVFIHPQTSSFRCLDGAQVQYSWLAHPLVRATLCTYHCRIRCHAKPSRRRGPILNSLLVLVVPFGLVNRHAGLDMVLSSERVWFSFGSGTVFRPRMEGLTWFRLCPKAQSLLYSACASPAWGDRLTHNHQCENCRVWLLSLHCAFLVLLPWLVSCNLPASCACI